MPGCHAAAWRRHFAPRLYTSQAVAEWAMRPTVVAGTVPLFRCFPSLLTLAARLSGKATQVVRPRGPFPSGLHGSGSHA